MNTYKELLNSMKLTSASDEKKAQKVAWDETYLTLANAKNLEQGSSVEIRVRLLPDVKAISVYSGPYTRYYHGWKSRLTDKYTEITCAPRNERGYSTCPLCKKSIEGYRSNDPITKDESRIYRRQTAYYVNCYVIDNPLNPAQNGKVRVMKFGPSIKAIYDVAATGRNASEIGNKIFDLSTDGYTFVIHAERRGEWPKYDGSYVDNHTNSVNDVKTLTDDEIEKIYDSTIEIPKLFPVSTAEDCEKFFRKHFLCDESVDNPVAEGSSDKPVESEEPVVNESRAEEKPVEKPAQSVPTPNAEKGDVIATTDAEVDALLNMF